MNRRIAALALAGSALVLSVAGLADAASATSYSQPPAKVGVATSSALTPP